MALAKKFITGMQYQMKTNMPGERERGTASGVNSFYPMFNEDLKTLAAELTKIIGVPLSGKQTAFNSVRIPEDHLPLAFTVVGSGDEAHIEVVWPKWIGPAPVEGIKYSEKAIPRRTGG